MIDYIKEILKGNRLPYRKIKQLMVLANEKNIDKVIEFAVIQYAENFDFKIKQLLLKYPKDYEDFYLDEVHNDLRLSYNQDKQKNKKNIILDFATNDTSPYPILSE